MSAGAAHQKDVWLRLSSSRLRRRGFSAPDNKDAMAATRFSRSFVLADHSFCLTTCFG
jgi:hypothetical protein